MCNLHIQFPQAPAVWCLTFNMSKNSDENISIDDNEDVVFLSRLKNKSGDWFESVACSFVGNALNNMLTHRFGHPGGTNQKRI